MCNKTSRNLYYSLAAVIMISSSFFSHAETTQQKGCKDKNTIQNTLSEDTTHSKQDNTLNKNTSENVIPKERANTNNSAKNQPKELMQGAVDWSLWTTETNSRRALIISALQKALAVAFILTCVSLVARKKRRPSRIDDTQILKAICVD